MTHSSFTNTDEQKAIDALFACLAQRDRRLILGTLYEQDPDPATEQELAALFSHQLSEGSKQATEASQRIETSLSHTHLPQLETADLIVRENADSITLADHPAFEDTGIVAVLTGETDTAADSLDALFDCLAHHRRRTILDVLSHQLQPIHLETLARELGAREQDITEQEVTETAVDQIVTRLHHAHLPKLADADLISYDMGNDTVAYEGHPDLRVPWMHSVLEPDFRASLTDHSDPQDPGTIEGRENVVSYGQSLFDRADEELFCMFTHTDMLEAGCLSRIRHASRRGVTVYLGARDPTVREYVQENVPEVILWEPKTDWLNLPAEGNAVGRLVLSDREAVMLGTLKEPLDDEIPEEKAITGDGSDSALVVMIRQLLHSHLDQIDDEAEAVGATLPL